LASVFEGMGEGGVGGLLGWCGLLGLIFLGWGGPLVFGIVEIVEIGVPLIS